MEFTVHHHLGSEPFDGDAVWYLEAERLIVFDGAGNKRTYSPSGWTYVEEAVKTTPAGPPTTNLRW